MTTEAIPVLEYGTTITTYADQLARIERHGPVSHLIFCHTQMEGGVNGYGDGRRIAVVGSRVIVPTAMLAQMARQLVCDPRVMEMVDLSSDLDSAAARH
jgi:hypothetical protein